MTPTNKWQRFWSWRERLQRYERIDCSMWNIAELSHRRKTGNYWGYVMEMLTGGVLNVIEQNPIQRVAKCYVQTPGSWNGGLRTQVMNLQKFHDLILKIFQTEKFIVQLWLMLFLLLMQIIPPRSEIIRNYHRTMNVTELERRAPGFGVGCFLYSFLKKLKSEWANMGGLNLNKVRHKVINNKTS